VTYDVTMAPEMGAFAAIILVVCAVVYLICWALRTPNIDANVLAKTTAAVEESPELAPALKVSTGGVDFSFDALATGTWTGASVWPHRGWLRQEPIVVHVENLAANDQ
jgi:hypothetical protein